MEYATKTEIYQKIKKPLLERQRRGRINKCLEGLKQLIIDLSGNRGILRMDKAEIFENTIAYFRQDVIQQKITAEQIPSESFRSGYMNAVNEVSRVLASSPGMTVEIGKSIMTNLGRSYNRLQQQYKRREQSASKHNQQQQQQILLISFDCPSSPASSGYHSDDDDSPKIIPAQVWRPW